MAGLPAVRARPPGRAFLAVGLALAGIAAAYVSLSSGEGVPHRPSRWTMEPTGPDSADYDNLALSLASGRGFAHDWSDSEALRPFREAARVGRPPSDPEILVRTAGAHPTALRPPLYSALLATVYRLFGRDELGFAVARLLNCLGVGIVGLVAFRLASRSGTARGWLAAAFVAGNLRLITASGHLASDVVGAALGALCLLALARAFEDLRAASCLAAGALLGAGILTRTILAAVAPWTVLATVAFGGPGWRRRTLSASAILAGLLVALLPWSLRNLAVGGQLTVTTQPLAALPGGYTLACLEADGAWLPPAQQPELAPLRQLDEWTAHRQGLRLTRDLIARRPELLPSLAARKLLRFWNPRLSESRHARELVVRSADFLLLLFGGLGTVLALREAVRSGGSSNPAALAAALMVVGVTAGVALTFELDRFRIVLAAPLALLAARAVLAAGTIVAGWTSGLRSAR